MIAIWVAGGSIKGGVFWMTVCPREFVDDCVPQKTWDDCVPQKIWDDRFNFSGKVSHSQNEKTISKKNHILKMKAHSETRFENERMFFEKWLILNLKWRCATKNLKWPCATDNLRWPCATKIQNDPVPQKIWNDRFNFSGNLSHFKNENTFRQITTFWKWKLILKLVLKMNAYFLKSD